MNKWECGTPDCNSVAVGVGGALGLRAIGWWFEKGAKPLCPGHRPDPTECRTGDVPCGRKGPCPSCKAEMEANVLQYVLACELMPEEGKDFVWYRGNAVRWVGWEKVIKPRSLLP